MGDSEIAQDLKHSDGIIKGHGKLLAETILLRDTLDILLNKSIEQKKTCDQLTQENKYLQDYVDSLMNMGNVLNK